MATQKPRLLVVDDDPGILKLVDYSLAQEGCQVLTANNGKDVIRMVRDNQPDVVLLDVMLPGTNGMQVCSALRAESNVPVIMLTAKAEEEHILQGFSLGADDYVTKPFSVDELKARVKAVLRRGRFAEEMPRPPMEYGGIAIDFDARQVTVNGEGVQLTATEYRLLALLFTNIGRVLTYDYILGRIWGEEYEGDLRLLQVAMCRLRNKLAQHTTGEVPIENRTGIGYVVPRAQ